MKKLLIAITTLAMIVAFLPKAEAADNAKLDLSVTFDINHPPYWVIEPQDSTVVAGDTLVIKVLAEDPDGDELFYGCAWYLNGVRQDPGVLPEGATFTWKGIEVGFIPNLTWEIPRDINLSDVHEFEFLVTDRWVDSGTVSYAAIQIAKKILVTILPPPEPLRIWSEPAGPFEVMETQTLKFKVIAEDLDTVNVYPILAVNVPPNAEWIQDYGPISAQRRSGTFIWTPSYGQAQDVPYRVLFRTRNTEGDDVELVAEITVLPATISISLEGPNPWDISGIGLGEERSNFDASGMCQHNVVNDGDVTVSVDLRYAFLVDSDGDGEPDTFDIPPDIVAGIDRFVTYVVDATQARVALPPDGSPTNATPYIEPGMSIPLPLTYGAPTGLTQNVSGMSAAYEVRACPPIMIEPH